MIDSSDHQNTHPKWKCPCGGPIYKNPQYDNWNVLLAHRCLCDRYSENSYGESGDCTGSSMSYHSKKMTYAEYKEKNPDKEPIKEWYSND